MCAPLRSTILVTPQSMARGKHLYPFQVNLGPGIISDSMNDVCFMHIQGGKLYGTSITGQVLWEVLIFPNGLNPFEVRPSLTFLLSAKNSWCNRSNDVHASLSVGCLNTPSLVRPSACHLIWDAIYSDIKRLCRRGMSGNHRNTFTGHFFLDNIGWPSSSKWISSFHLDSPHTVHESNSPLAFQNNMQSLRHVGNKKQIWGHFFKKHSNSAF
jgi:hypothetical protein